MSSNLPVNCIAEQHSPSPGERAPSLALVPRRLGLPVFFLLVLGACATPKTTGPDGTGFLLEVPEGVIQIAAPYQNLQQVILKPEDGCYWYRHVGPVETTMLPLRTVEGRPICTGVAAKPAATG